MAHATPYSNHSCSLFVSIHSCSHSSDTHSLSAVLCPRPWGDVACGSEESRHGPGSLQSGRKVASHNSRVLAVISALEQAPWQGGLPSRGHWGWLSGEAALGPSYPLASVKPRPWFSGETEKDQCYRDPLSRGESEWSEEIRDG